MITTNADKLFTRAKETHVIDPDQMQYESIEGIGKLPAEMQFDIANRKNWPTVITLCNTPNCPNRGLFIPLQIPHEDGEVVCGICNAQVNPNFRVPDGWILLPSHYLDDYNSTGSY